MRRRAQQQPREHLNKNSRRAGHSVLRVCRELVVSLQTPLYIPRRSSLLRCAAPIGLPRSRGRGARHRWPLVLQGGLDANVGGVGSNGTADRATDEPSKCRGDSSVGWCVEYFHAPGRARLGLQVFWLGIGQAGNLMPSLRASSIRRSRSDAFSASVAVCRFTPAASYMR